MWFRSVRTEAVDACTVEDPRERDALIDAHAEKLYRAAWATHCERQQEPEPLYQTWLRLFYLRESGRCREIEREAVAACTFDGDRTERHEILRRELDNRLREIYKSQGNGSAVTPA